MGVITALEVQKRNKERVNVYLDGEYHFSINLMDAAKLRKGQTLSDADIARLQSDDDVVKAVESAVRFLAYRPRSVAEVRRNLAEKSIEESVIAAAVEQLSALSYLDDRAFARFWVDNRTMFKPLGLTALRYELRQKGVDETIIADVLDDLDIEAAVYQAAQTQVRRLRGTDTRTFRTKMASFLQRRGFNYAAINDVLTRLIDELHPEGYFADDDDTP